MKMRNLSHIIKLIIMVALIVSLAVNYMLYTRSQLYFTLYEQTILDPMGMDHYRPNDKPEVPEGKGLVVFLGDSRALAWPAPESDRFVIANRGVGWQTSAQVVGRFSDDIRTLQPDIIVIQVGINDLTAIPTFPNRRARIIARCKDNIQKLTDQSIAMDSTVILTTIFPVRRTLFPWEIFGSEEVVTSVEEVNQFIHSLARENVIVLDTGQILADASGNLNSEYSLDTLHLNAQGYQALNVSLSAMLESIPTSKPTPP